MSQRIKTQAGDREDRDTFTEVLRTGARKLIAQALEAEMVELLATYAEQRDEQGRVLVKATACLEKDREELLTFFQFPAHHWQSLRTTNPIESTFGTIRHRTTRTKGCLTRDGLLHMMFKLGQCAEKTWRRLRGFRQLAQVMEGVQFHDGLEATTDNPVAA